jgi:hypothetical protein
MAPLIMAFSNIVEMDLLSVWLNAMCAPVTGASEENTKGIATTLSDMLIGVDTIRGEPELCIFAIGLGQLIGRCVGRDNRTGRFVSLTRHLVIGAYTDSEPVELERRPNPRKAPAVAARLVVGLTLVIVTATMAKAAIAARIAATLLAAGARAARWAAGYIDREFVQQWRLALAVAPVAIALVWLACQ